MIIKVPRNPVELDITLTYRSNIPTEEFLNSYTECQVTLLLYNL
jgi:hypothetical protein